MEAHVPQVTHEAERVARLPIALTALWVLLFSGVLSVVAVWVFFTRSQSLPNPPQAHTQPRGEVSNVRVDLLGGVGSGQALKIEQHRRLSHYGWVDRERGLVHIPIDVAMELELKEAQR